MTTSDPTPAPPAALLHTPLHALHLELGARMVPFAGYAMPVSYPAGILAEHRQCRESAVLFDVSHMGQLRLNGDDAAAALETLVPVDIVGLAPGKQRYALFTNDAGGILDDLMVTRRDDHLFLDRQCRLQGGRHAHSARAPLHPLPDRAAARACAAGAAGSESRRRDGAPRPGADEAHLHDRRRRRRSHGIACFATRSGYTGEDGFEISVAAAEAEALARALLAEPEVAPAGLGARDTLRLEAGLCLYGHDIDTTTTPVQAGLTWAIQKVRRPGGERAGGYPGEQTIAAPAGRRRADQARRPRRPRAGAGARRRAHRRRRRRGLGRVTSGTVGPSVGQPIAMAYVPRRSPRRHALMPTCAASASRCASRPAVRAASLLPRLIFLPFDPSRSKR